MLVTNRGAARLVASGGWAGLTAPHVLLLARNQAVPTVDLNTVSQITEYAGTGYTGGFGGASRQVPGSLAVNEDDTNDRAELDAADVTFTGVVGPAPIAPLAAIVEEITDDAGSNVIAFIPIKLAVLAVTAATAASPAELTTASAHGLTTGDLIYVEGAAGGTWGAGVNGKVFTVTVVDADQFTIDGLNASGFGTATFASFVIYRPLAMNGASVQVQWDAEGIIQLVPQVGAAV
jgi:hypothetical protein